MSNPYAPPGYSQIDGSAYQQENCVLATLTDLIDRCTVGGIRIQAPKLRQISGDTSGGISYQQAAETADRATGGRVKLLPRFGLGRGQVRDLAQSGVPFGISIDTAVTRYTRFHTGTFVGGHTVYVQDYDDVSNTFLVEDPGTTAEGYLNWPEDLLFRAAERRSGGTISVLVGRDTEGVTRTARNDERVRGTTSVTGPILATIRKGAHVAVVLTTNGGQWPREGGGVANGWHKVRFAGKVGYVRGRALA